MEIKEFLFLKEDDVRRINSILLEGLFFHRGDHADLYETLYGNADKFHDFWRRVIGKDLVIREHYAYRRHENTPSDPFTGFSNPALPNAGRWHFGWHGRDGKVCMLIFVSFLHWYETVLRTAPPTNHGEHAFTDHNFWLFLQERLNDFFTSKPDVKPNPANIERCFARVLTDMARFGFILEVERRDVDDVEAARRQGFNPDVVHKYLARPGLTAYDPMVLQQDPAQFQAAFFGADSEPEQGEE